MDTIAISYLGLYEFRGNAAAGQENIPYPSSITAWIIAWIYPNS